MAILFDDAYGLAITDELEKQSGRSVTISAVHKALVRLEEKGFLVNGFCNLIFLNCTVLFILLPHPNPSPGGEGLVRN